MQQVAAEWQKPLQCTVGKTKNIIQIDDIRWSMHRHCSVLDKKVMDSHLANAVPTCVTYVFLTTSTARGRSQKSDQTEKQLNSWL